jgi:hypothetical protein
MKKYILSSLAVLSAATMFTACNDNLDTDPRVTEMTAATFPGKPGDVDALNAATYSIMNTLGGGDNSGLLNNPYYWWSMMSDDNYGSGGLQDKEAKSLHHLVMCSVDQYEYDFTLLYGGVSRANTQIETIDNVEWTDAQKPLRNQLLGEAFFMRGFYNLLLTQMYGDVPLITSSLITDEMQTQVSAQEVIYPQIVADFATAIKLMDEKSGYGLQGDGHANKYAAEAFLARAWMFWAGFYEGKKDLSTEDATMALVDRAGEPIKQADFEFSSVSKNDVIGYLKDIVASGRYKLLKDFRSLWQYSNSKLWAEAHDGEDGGNAEGTHAYAFIADMALEDCFDMPGNGNGNNEEIFQIQFLNASKWEIGGTYCNPRMYSNYLSCFWGLRNGATNDNGKRDKTYPFNQGWGQGTPSCNIYDDWKEAQNKQGHEYTDIRMLGSMIDLDNELESYTYEKDDCEESGYSVKKYADVNLDANPKDNDSWWKQVEGYSSSSLGNEQQGDHFQDFYLMRYADVLLMLAELTGDVSYINQVRARANVPLLETYKLEYLQDERRWEFAFEGLRFNDMRRWSGCDGHSESSYAAKALQKQEGKQIVCLGDKANKQTLHHMTCSWAKRYAATKGFLAKPQTQITLMHGKLIQNEGWDASNAEALYKVIYQ